MLARITGCVALITTLCLCVAVNSDDAGQEAKRNRESKTFDDTIALLLSRRCLDCHNATDKKGGLDLSSKAAMLKGGDSGAALTPGRLGDSLLWERITDGDMPPKAPLAADEKRLLSAWITSGAKWGTDPIDRFRVTTSNRAGYDWWSLKPLRRPEIPDATSNGPDDWQQNPIDAFVLAKLRKQKLTPSASADKRTLIRRLSFDLVGLPPTPEDIDAFLADKSPGAYERLVDRLLASPHYGERWARHWLDIVRFGESQGFERDKLRPNSWRYRDWVTAAFNDDLPYDEFARRQLAGDVLNPDDPSAAIATGFLVAGPYDEVGQSQQSAAMRAVVRQDELEDVVSVVGQTFLGLTINCARCHDHKFDPVLQSEYYQLTAALGGVRHGERNIGSAATSAASSNFASALQARIDSLNRQNAQLEEAARKQLLAEQRGKPRPKVTVPEPIARWTFDGNLNDAIGKLHGTSHGKAKVKAGRLHTDGKSGYVTTVPIDRDISSRTLEAWVKLDSLDQRGGGVVSLQTLDGSVFDAIVFGEQTPRRWLPGSSGFQRTQQFGGTDETTANNGVVHVAIVYRANGTITGYRNGRPYGKSYKSNGPVTFKKGQAQLLFGLRHMPPGGNRFLAAEIDKVHLYDRALTPAQIAASAGVSYDSIDTESLLAKLRPVAKQLREQRLFEIARLESQRIRAQATRSYAVVPRTPEPAFLLKRGNPVLKGRVVTPGGVAAVVGVDADFALAADSPDADRRIALARWLSDRKNPLFARVIVNRLWHYHFGIGLVETPSDFGFNGARPTHPLLIDHLAGELIRSDWSLKALQRAIVLSATYRQASRSNSDAEKIDAGNRLLWQKSPVRLEAEVLRDTILTVAGELNPALAGPGYEDFTTFSRNSQFYQPVDAIGQSFHRRSLYRTWVRSGRNRFLDVFDCPDPSTKTPRRAVTTTPLQALALLNNSFVLRMADRLADRLQREAGDDPKQQVERAYVLAYGRSATPDERRLTTRFVKQHGLPAFCRVIFNSNEFLHVD